jgi:hypothetical protein
MRAETLGGVSSHLEATAPKWVSTNDAARVRG